MQDTQRMMKERVDETFAYAVPLSRELKCSALVFFVLYVTSCHEDRLHLNNKNKTLLFCIVFGLHYL